MRSDAPLPAVLLLATMYMYMHMYEVRRTSQAPTSPPARHTQPIAPCTRAGSGRAATYVCMCTYACICMRSEPAVVGQPPTSARADARPPMYACVHMYVYRSHPPSLQQTLDHKHVLSQISSSQISSSQISSSQISSSPALPGGAADLPAAWRWSAA